MNKLVRRLILQSVGMGKKSSHLSRLRVAREIYKFRVASIHLLKDMGLMTIGVLSAGFGLESFLLPNSFTDGGVTGISMLTTAATGWSLSLLIILFNIPFLFLGYKQLGLTFALKSVGAILALASALAFFDYPIITSDKLLVAVFGGFFVGAGIGFAVRGGSVLDGTEILAIFLSRRTGMTIGDVILIFNIAIFSVAAYLLSMESALYSILAYLAASKTVDFIIEGVEEYTGVTIVSSHSDEIRMMIIQKMGRGVTILQGKRGYGKKGDNLGEIDVIYTVITRLEIARLQTETDKIDPNAFMVMTAIKDTRGGMIKKRPLSK